MVLGACWAPNLDGYQRCARDGDCVAQRLCQGGVCTPVGPTDGGSPVLGLSGVEGITVDGEAFEPVHGYATRGSMDELGPGLILMLSNEASALEDVRAGREVLNGRVISLWVAEVGSGDGGPQEGAPGVGTYNAFVRADQTGPVFWAQTRRYDNCAPSGSEDLLGGQLRLDTVTETHVSGQLTNVLLGEAEGSLSLRFHLPVEPAPPEPGSPCEPVVHGTDCQAIKADSGIAEGGGYYTVRGADDRPLRVWCNETGWALVARVTASCPLWNAVSESANENEADGSCYGLPLQALDPDATGASSLFKVLISAESVTKTRIFTGTSHSVWSNGEEALIDADGFIRVNPGTEYTVAYVTSQQLIRFHPSHAWAVSSCTATQCEDVEGSAPCRSGDGRTPAVCVEGYQAGLDQDGFVLHKDGNGQATNISGWGTWEEAALGSLELWLKPAPPLEVP